MNQSRRPLTFAVLGGAGAMGRITVRDLIDWYCSGSAAKLFTINSGPIEPAPCNQLHATGRSLMSANDPFRTLSQTYRPKFIKCRNLGA